MPRNLTTEQLLTAAATHIRNLDAELNAMQEQLNKARGTAAPAAPASPQLQAVEVDGLVKSTRNGYSTSTEAPVPSAFAKGIANHRARLARPSADDVVSSDGFARGAQALAIEAAQVRETLRKGGAPLADDVTIKRELIRRARHHGIQRDHARATSYKLDA
jgi:hypothetical protein